MTKKVKNTVLWTYVINNLNGKDIIGTFMKKNSKNQIKNYLDLEKQSREKEINYKLNGKDTIIRLIAGYIKKAYTKE